MTRLSWLVLPATVWLSSGILPAAQELRVAGVSAQFQEAITLMESRGDCRGAVSLFERVIEGTDRALAARALVYLGTCYERLGRPDPASAYRRITEQFPDQIAAATQARARLAVLARISPARRAPPTVSLRRTWTAVPPDMAASGVASRDGRFLAYVDRRGELALADIASGDLIRRVATADNGTIGIKPVPAPDGSAVAYSWEPASGPVELRLAKADDTTADILFRARRGESLLVLDWPRTDRLLLEITGVDRRASLVIISIPEGAFRLVTTLPASPTGASLSHDGRFVAYGMAVEHDGQRSDIFVMPAAGGPPILVVGGPSDDRLPVWTLRNERLLFVSDRTGAAGLWGVPMESGRATSPPELLQPEIGRVVAVLGLTETGTLHYLRQVGLVDVYTVPVDHTGRPSGSPRGAATDFIGSNMMPAFSPDGQSLAYLAQMSTGAQQVLAVQHLAKGTTRTIPTGMALLRLPRWSPSGTQLLVKGNDKAGHYGFHLLEPGSGDVAPIKTVPPDAEDTLGAVSWARDGRAILYGLSPRDGPPAIVRLDLPTRTEEVYLRLDASARLITFALSPVDETLAMLVGRQSSTALIVRTPDGSERELLSLQAPDRITGIAWMPDGRSLVFVRTLAGDRVTRLWRIESGGGEPQPLWIEAVGLRDVVISPDGKHLAYTAGFPSREPWVLENFLPGPRPAAAASTSRPAGTSAGRGRPTPKAQRPKPEAGSR
jgi:Tol biopolymer transport system component